MREKLINYLKERKLLCILLGIYVLLSVFCIVYLTTRSDDTLITSPLTRKILRQVGLDDNNENNDNLNNPNPTSDVGLESNPNNTTEEVSEELDDTELDKTDSNESSVNDDPVSSEPEGGDSNNLTANVAFYADSQEDTNEEDANHTRVVNYILSSGANTVFHIGDIMEDGTQNSMDRFSSVTELLRNTKTFYAALGNNDRVEGDSSKPSTIFLNFFNFPGNERWYSVNIGNLHMIVLDSAFASLSPGSSQYNWLVSDLQSDAAKSRIVGVMFHHPDASSQISSLLAQNHVDFVISGHVHTYTHSSNSGVDYFTTTGQPSIGYLKALIYENNVIIKSYNSSNGNDDVINIPNQ